jgi:formiminoglutamase
MPPSSDDPRIGDLLGAALDDGAAPRCVIAGFAVDEGVRRNGGRPGAADGPPAIRLALARLTPDAADPAPFAELVRHVRDLGDVGPTGDLEADQVRLADLLAPHLAAGAFAIVLGGGHETSYGHFLGRVRAHVDHGGAADAVRVLNWDAHPDVRPTIGDRGHSGTPFRQMLEHPAHPAARYAVAGLQPQSVAAAHLAWVRERGAAHFRDAVRDADAVRALYEAERPTLVSFDLDAVDAANAPGVSAPAIGGLDVATWLHAAYLCGRTASVRSMDVVELSPPHDADGRTARLAAVTVWHVLRGLAARGA